MTLQANACDTSTEQGNRVCFAIMLRNKSYAGLVPSMYSSKNPKHGLPDQELTLLAFEDVMDRRVGGRVAGGRGHLVNVP